MTLIRIFIPASPPQVSCSCKVGVTYDFVKRSMIPRGKLGINYCENIFSDSNNLDVLLDNRLKTITRLAFHFRDRMRPKQSRHIQTLRRSIGLANRQQYTFFQRYQLPPIPPLCDQFYVTYILQPTSNNYKVNIVIIDDCILVTDYTEHFRHKCY